MPARAPSCTRPRRASGLASLAGSSAQFGPSRLARLVRATRCLVVGLFDPRKQRVAGPLGSDAATPTDATPQSVNCWWWWPRPPDSLSNAQAESNG